jgi:hypothetical protein
MRRNVEIGSVTITTLSRTIISYQKESHKETKTITYPSMALQSFFGPWPLFQFLNLYTDGRTPWTGDQPVARPLPTHTTTQTQNKRKQISTH